MKEKVRKKDLTRDLSKKSILTSNLPEEEFSQRASMKDRKKYAQFFTPFAIADFMAKWVIANPKCSTILEPAFGLGVFSRAILNLQVKNILIDAFEIDRAILQEAEKIFANILDENTLQLHPQNYMSADWESRYDGIICNPPYCKFHDYDNKSILREVNQRLGIKLNGFTNLYALFLIKSIYQLNEGGRAAYIVPSEFLNSNYGERVKEFLLESKALRYLIAFSFEEKIFGDALTTASILLLAKDGGDRHIQFINIQTKSELNSLAQIVDNYPETNDIAKTKNFPASSISPDKKWRNYYGDTVTNKYRNLVPLSDYAKVVRGIATGDNNFFIFNREKQKQHRISDRNLLPCITSARQISNLFFTRDSWEQLASQNKNIFLIDLSQNTKKDEMVKKYIEFGEEIGVNRRHLTSRRNPWYALEKREAAPIWISVFNRTGLKFVRNEAKILNLTAFHGLYLNALYETKTDLLFAYFLTEISKAIIDDNRREYGNGLKKFEPNDLNSSLVIDFTAIPADLEAEILAQYHLLRITKIEAGNGREYLDELELIFKQLLAK